LGTILPRFEGRVLVIDTGVSEYYGEQLGSLLIENDKAIVIQGGEQIKIPEGDENLLPYLKTILEIEPDAGLLRNRIEELENHLPEL
jgi:hypothetical protein